VNANSAAIELGAIAGQVRQVAEGLGAGEVREVTVHTGELVTVLRPLTKEYFLALSLKPDGNTGKGRYLMRVVGPKLLAELA
jgi:predicted regulator of Ras-like GTPase activity (Roadblock/LC7/MglB family)